MDTEKDTDMVTDTDMSCNGHGCLRFRSSCPSVQGSLFRCYVPVVLPQLSRPYHNDLANLSRVYSVLFSLICQLDLTRQACNDVLPQVNCTSWPVMPVPIVVLSRLYSRSFLSMLSCSGHLVFSFPVLAGLT
jgi:hypothetical protein